jgi:hypothetical protein
VFSKLLTVHVGFEVFTVVTMKSAVFWDVTQCGCLKNDVSEEHVTANVVPSSLIFST